MASSLDGAATTEYSTYTITVVSTTTQDTAIFNTNPLGQITGTIYFLVTSLSSDTLTLTEAFTTSTLAVSVPPLTPASTSPITPAVSASPVASSPTTSTNSAFDPSTPTSKASSGLSPGAKAGIGVGVAVVFLIFAAFIAGCLIVRRRRRRISPLSEVVSPAQEAGYHKPELDATEIPRPSDRRPGGGRPEKPEVEANLAQQSHVGIQDHRAELDAAQKLRTDGRAELDGRMVPNNGEIR